MPLGHYDLAVLRHLLVAPETAQAIPCRVIFVSRTADAKVAQEARAKAVTKIRTGLGNSPAR